MGGVDQVPGVRPAETYITILSPPQLNAMPIWATPGTGSDGGKLTENDFIGTGTASTKTGLYALEEPGSVQPAVHSSFWRW
jgi:hypothetical protein